MKTLNLTASGRTGKQWLAHLEKEKYNVSSYAKELILSDDFDKARGKKGTEYEIVIVQPTELALGKYPTTAEIKVYATKQGWTVPTPEIALLVREAVSDKEMEELGGWYITALHDTIADSGGDPDVLNANRSSGGRRVFACYDSPQSKWGTSGMFAFVVPGKVSARALDIQTKHSESLPLVLEINGFTYKRT